MDINAFPLIYPETRNLDIGSYPKKRERISDSRRRTSRKYVATRDYQLERIYPKFIFSSLANLNKNLINRSILYFIQVFKYFSMQTKRAKWDEAKLNKSIVLKNSQISKRRHKRKTKWNLYWIKTCCWEPMFIWKDFWTVNSLRITQIRIHLVFLDTLCKSNMQISSQTRIW